MLCNLKSIKENYLKLKNNIEVAIFSTKIVFRVINGIGIEYVDIEIDEVARVNYKEKQNYVRRLHKEFNDIYKNEKVLEISTKSPVDLGKKLSAFNLEYEVNNKK